MVASRDNLPLLAELLADQQRLDTPVARFSRAHDSGVVSPNAPPSGQLIPLSQPGPGEQYAFEVDLDSCTGCKSCVAACHSLNGLDDTETWRDVGLLVSPSRRHPFTQTITSACHHCADPACLNGCPVLAYEKDPLTGIVRHLDDQCIGCSYCVLKCPYDAPKFSARLGIVRKCDMCHGRLSVGEAPACAQACPTHAIRIVTAPVAASTQFLRAAPSPDYTQPTTRYVSRRPLPENLVAADAPTPRVQPAHWPLAVMLTLIPAAVGLGLAGALSENVPFHVTLFTWLLGAAGLAVSVFHLGKPLRAWRIFLGWRKSWLTREALVFGAWFGLATLALFFALLPTSDEPLRRSVVSYVPHVSGLVGIAGVFCSAMIYVDTRRHFWRAAQTFPRFYGTTLLFATGIVAPTLAGVVLLTKLAWESRTCHDGSASARLQRGPLLGAAVARDALGLFAAALLFIAPGPLALVVLLLGELAERHLFFRAVDAPKMPGVPA